MANINDVLAKSTQPPASIVDTTSDVGYYYFCKAVPGALQADPVWQIMRYTIATGEFLFADGDSNFDNIAANRSLLDYA